MKKQLCLLVLCALILTMFTGCGHEHSYGKWKTEKEATCEKEGRKVRACECGEEETKSIPKLEHEYESKVTKEAACEQEGVEKFTCKHCDDSYTEAIPKLEHEYEISKEKEASCQAEGTKIFTCTKCQESYTEALPQTSYTSTEIYEMYLNSVGEVVTYDRNGEQYGLGSCFVYSADGKLITNYHVMEGARYAEVTFGEKTYEIEQVLAYDKNIDVAVLKISAKDLEPAVLCELEHSVGEVVYAFGNSRGLTSTFSDGMITYSDREMDGVHYVQHDAPISGGNSGGPLINIYGEVIGINTWTVRDSQNLNFAICISELDNLDDSDPMTMEEFYQTEENLYQAIVDYTMTYGDDSGTSYFLGLDEFYSSDNESRYLVFSSYFPDDEELLIGFSINSEYYVYFILDQDASGVYEWYYFDDYDYNMDGVIYASSYTSDTLLGYSYHNIDDSDLLTSVRGLASTMMNNLCLSLTDAFADLGITAADLGFSYYE